MDGDFETIRTFIRALNEMNPNLNFGEEVIDTIEVAFRKLREVFLSTHKYFKLVRFELMRLYELQHELRQLSYFDILGRLRLTMTIARVLMEIPIMINVASKGEEDKAAATAAAAGKEANKDDNMTANKEGREGGIFGERVEKVLRMVVGLLEKGEKLATTTSTRGSDSDSDDV
ncbi:hypothetical protein BC937DRAFT_86604 [Endogone sp. FLAS-F59071]|nr:hypothetical protein BC937DRAFT_86604 [Endogone sp. FLAS-F59071]|eukprot:RUS19981.1 hypothetical protein BC937DRAFT_86604 [Endogone sp. FLAS-F59071]